MTIAAIRTKLMTIIADADDKKVKALYKLLTNAEEENGTFELTDAYKAMLDERRASYLSGKSKARPWKEVHNDVRAKLKKA